MLLQTESGTKQCKSCSTPLALFSGGVCAEAMSRKPVVGGGGTRRRCTVLHGGWQAGIQA